MSIPEGWAGYRGICLLNVFSKLFMGVALEVAKRWASTQISGTLHFTLLYGFEKGSPCEDLLMTLQSLVVEASGRGRRWPLWILNCDVRQACPYHRPDRSRGASVAQGYG